jgi:AcrR family transcriptional regulator
MAAELTTADRRRRASHQAMENGIATRERLLDTAERLFAMRGLDSVSIRDITEESGDNTAAIHYHFGSKRDLLVAILRRRAPVLGEHRERLLDEIDASTSSTLRDVVEAMVRPIACLMASDAGGRNYVAFLGALGSHPEYMSVVIDANFEYTERCLACLARFTPDLPYADRLLRFGLGKDLINRVLGQPNGQVRVWLAARHVVDSDEDLVEKVIDIVVGLLQGPSTDHGPVR